MGRRRARREAAIHEALVSCFPYRQSWTPSLMTLSRAVTLPVTASVLYAAFSGHARADRRCCCIGPRQVIRAYLETSICATSPRWAARPRLAGPVRALAAPRSCMTGGHIWAGERGAHRTEPARYRAVRLYPRRSGATRSRSTDRHDCRYRPPARPRQMRRKRSPGSCSALRLTTSRSGLTPTGSARLRRDWVNQAISEHRTA